MNELVEIDRLLADLKRHSGRHGLAYGEVVMIEDLISAFDHARARAAEDLATMDGITSAFENARARRLGSLETDRDVIPTFP